MRSRQLLLPVLSVKRLEDWPHGSLHPKGRGDCSGRACQRAGALNGGEQLRANANLGLLRRHPVGLLFIFPLRVGAIRPNAEKQSLCIVLLYIFCLV
jgi:hypothetical protein